MDAEFEAAYEGFVSKFMDIPRKHAALVKGPEGPITAALFMITRTTQRTYWAEDMSYYGKPHIVEVNRVR